ncbi:MAG TPA: phasin family protein [Ramlibacter sp.]
MATRTSRTVAPAKAQTSTPAARAPWEWLSEWNRQQVAVANEGVRTIYRGFEAMRRIQEQAAQATAERHAAAAQKLRGKPDAAEFAALQGELLREDFAGAARYWQDLAGALLEMNTELLNCATQMVDTEDVFAATSPRFLHS